MSVCFPDLVFIYVYSFNNIIRRGINWEIYPYFNHFVNCTQLNTFYSCIFLHKDVCEEQNHFLLDYICFVLRFENTHKPLNELLLLDTTRTFIHGQILCIITWQTPLRGHPYHPQEYVMCSSVGWVLGTFVSTQCS